MRNRRSESTNGQKGGGAPKRTSALKAFIGTVKMFLRPAMFGWTLRAFGTAAMLLIPLAAASAFYEIPPKSRGMLLGASAALFAAAWGLRRLGGFIRSRRSSFPRKRES